MHDTFWLHTQFLLSKATVSDSRMHVEAPFSIPLAIVTLTYIKMYVACTLRAEPGFGSMQLACVPTQRAPRCGQRWAAALWMQQCGSTRSRVLLHWNPRRRLRGLRSLDSTVLTVHISSAYGTNFLGPLTLCFHMLRVCQHQRCTEICLHIAALRSPGNTVVVSFQILNPSAGIEPGLVDQCLAAARSNEPADASIWEAMGTLAGLSARGAHQGCLQSALSLWELTIQL